MPKIQLLEDCLTKFKTTLDADVKSLMSLYATESVKPGPPASWLSALLRSSCVLLVANFENFIEGLFCASLTHLATNNVVADKYPKRFRYWLFRKETHMRNIGVEAAKEYIELSQRLFNPVRALTLTELRLDDLKEEFANPTPSNVNWMAELFDEKDYVDRVTILVLGVSTKAKAAIGELAKRRNDIAHGDAMQKPKEADVVRLTKFCQLFGNQITKDVTKWTNKCI